MNEVTMVNVLVIFMLCILAFIISRSYFNSDIRITGLLIIIFIVIMVFLNLLEDYFYTIAILILAVIIYGSIKKE